MKRDVRLLPIAGCVWAAALVCVFVPAAPWWCAIAGSGGALVVGGGVVWRGDRSASRAALVLVMLAAVAAIGAAVLIATPARESAASWHGRVVEATGQVTSSASVGVDGRLWMEVQLTGVGSPGAVRSASAPGRVGVDPADGFDLGAVIRVTGEAAATDPGERAALVVFASAATVDAPASGVFSIAADLRRIFIDRARALPEPGDGLLPGLAVGDTRAVSTELTEQMKASGLSHLTAVSGVKVTTIGG